MIKIWKAFQLFIKEIWKDVMLSIIFFVPIMVGGVFRFLVPVAEKYLCQVYDKTQIIKPYYYMFDETIILLVPIMCAYAGTMVILGELDNKLANYLVVTPLGKKGYLHSRITLISIIASIYGIIATCIFHLTEINVFVLIPAAILSFFIGMLVSLGIVAFAHNKVEGLALSKFSGFLLIGLLVSGLIQGKIRYLAAFLPSFWMGEFYQTKTVYSYVIGLLTAIFFLLIFYKRFSKRIS